MAEIYWRHESFHKWGYTKKKTNKKTLLRHPRVWMESFFGVVWIASVTLFWIWTCAWTGSKYNAHCVIVWTHYVNYVLRVLWSTYLPVLGDVLWCTNRFGSRLENLEHCGTRPWGGSWDAQRGGLGWRSLKSLPCSDMVQQYRSLAVLFSLCINLSNYFSIYPDIGLPPYCLSIHYRFSILSKFLTCYVSIFPIFSFCWKRPIYGTSSSLFICPAVYLSICPPIHLSAYLSTFL